MGGDFTFLKGNVETIILCSLYNQDKYGYEIAKDIKDKTENKYEIKQPTLYSYLKRLEEDNLITSYWGAESNGGRRRYYKLTEKGRDSCKQFISEWEYQRDLLGNLVDGTGAEVSEMSQEDATSLLGRKSQTTRRKPGKNKMQEQDEIARRLAELEAASAPEHPEPVQNATTAEEPQQSAANQAQSQVAATVATAPHEQQTPVAEQSAPSEEELQAAKAKFNVKQDNADDFIQDFDQLALDFADSQTKTEGSGENYQHVLMGVLGDQLEDMQQYSRNADIESPQSVQYTEHPAAIEDVADALAKSGIRMRIYNHAAATYKPKTLMPHAKVLCQTAWWTYLIALTYFGILALVSISANNWKPFIITFSVLLVAPLAFSIYAISNPGRKEKPNFSFKLAIAIAGTIAAIVILLFVSINILSHIELSDFSKVSVNILIPVGIALLLPTYVLIYNYYYTRY